ncbi:MAG: tryptophan 7-halogenase [Bacteroidetes bacterium]|nr:tryptophan 7-halogenase [Bacteroidota bacterium]
MIESTQQYDVAILGGGLAGLTLALQLSEYISPTNIIVLEKRSFEAPIAIHKVGESTSELGSSYLRNVLHLKDYLNEKQLLKFGFRFFMSPEHNNEISKRVELGSRIDTPFPTHQIDRGLLENEMMRIALEKGIQHLLDAKVDNVELGSETHTISFTHENKETSINAKWIVDSTGRNGFLRKKLKLQKEVDHNINAAWFRIKVELDIDNWSENTTWRNKVEPGKRRLATNHLMGNGYWVWIIPLVSGSTSIGIVADPRLHPFDQFNTFPKAKNWLLQHEPVAAKMITKHEHEILDFKVMKNMAYQSKQYFSADRWALTGEAASFMDPFYSPGTDFIALGNTWITELIKRDLRGDDILRHALIFNHAQNELIQGWIGLYRDQYSIFGKTQILILKVIWDWATYWAIPNVMFSNGGYTNLDVLKAYSSNKNESIGKRFNSLNQNMQKLFLDWGTLKTEPLSDKHINIFDIRCLRQFQKELVNKYSPEDLIEKVNSNLSVLESIAVAIFRLANKIIYGTPSSITIDPYHAHISIENTAPREHPAEQYNNQADQEIQEDIEKIFFS